MSDWVLYRRLFGLARPYWAHIVVLFVLNLLSTPLTLLGPLPLKIAVDSVVGSRPLPGFLERLVPETVTGSQTALLLLAVGLSVALALTSRLQSIAYSFLSTYTRSRMVLDFKTRLFRHAQRLSLSYHDSHGTADSVHRIQNNTTAIRDVAIDGLFPFVTKTLTFFGMLYVSLQIDVVLTLVALAAAPVFFLVTYFFRPRLRRHARRVNEIQSSVMGVLQEVLTSLRVVKAFGGEDREEARFVRHATEGIRARLRMLLFGSALGLVTGIAAAIVVAAVLYIGISHVLAGTLSLGNLLLLRNYLSQLEWPLRSIAKKYTKLQSCFARAERAFALLDEKPDVVERPNARPLERALGALSFRNVSFSYGEDRPVLRDISFAIEPGTRVGIAGPTGTGKTTLMNLMTRFYDPPGWGDPAGQRRSAKLQACRFA